MADCRAWPPGRGLVRTNLGVMSHLPLFRCWSGRHASIRAPTKDGVGAGRRRCVGKAGPTRGRGRGHTVVRRGEAVVRSLLGREWNRWRDQGRGWQAFRSQRRLTSGLTQAGGKGEHIDMAELLRDNLEAQRRAASTPSQTQGPSHLQKHRHEIPDLLSWVQCFGTYMAVVTSRYPAQAG